MLKNITVAICDICGRIEQAVLKGNQRDEYYDLPEGWKRTSQNHEFCICPTCWKKLNDKRQATNDLLNLYQSGR